MTELSRRRILLGALAAPAVAVVAGRLPAVAEAPTGGRLEELGIRSRATWAQAPPLAGLLPEPDVRFLLIHHTASSNEYAADEVPELLEGFRRFHMSADKDWPDVAYNFFVDRFGGIWEGRFGSLGGPVRADATGGNQGFAQLCCFIGDHQSVAPSPEAVESMAALLAALADRHSLDTAPGSTATFTSRGSNRCPAGAMATVRTISGHRDVSLTECPGDRAYELLGERLPAATTARRTIEQTPAAPRSSVSSGAGETEATTMSSPITAVALTAAGAAAGALAVLGLRRRRDPGD